MNEMNHNHDDDATHNHGNGDNNHDENHVDLPKVNGCECDFFLHEIMIVLIALFFSVVDELAAHERQLC